MFGHSTDTVRPHPHPLPRVEGGARQRHHPRGVFVPPNAALQTVCCNLRNLRSEDLESKRLVGALICLTDPVIVRLRYIPAPTRAPCLLVLCRLVDPTLEYDDDSSADTSPFTALAVVDDAKLEVKDRFLLLATEKGSVYTYLLDNGKPYRVRDSAAGARIAISPRCMITCESTTGMFGLYAYSPQTPLVRLRTHQLVDP